MTTDTAQPAAWGGSGPSSAPSLEAGAERERTLDRLEARMEALQFSMRTRRSSPRLELWRQDLCETRETWIRLADPDGQDPTREGN
ncbi:hypothetical protein [Streptomyces galbus]|uniref:Uncharacterized protein n=1 Tax=Streptomyces galbus TaxID=33898 RepID=A0A4U5WVP2_STRGB|nr:hypothetical protein [Streptomyces galbus]TKT06544.1 hypothetical protein E4U92_26865 [Streptomyces galbus]GHD53959.1 hypothetical protein GCM10010335_67910 [Streptomyces galbus]